ncbi:MAG: hypothetical protein MUE98_00050 [Rhodobacteraceae bacterium]|jgi:hypothetical protein|nr:hypothetical protein [Paracoccaceae bacterium]
MADVIRTDTEHMRVSGKWFRTADLADAAFDLVRRAGSENPAFDMPPFFYTGSPYGEALLALGVAPCDPPPSYRVMFTPHFGKSPWWRRAPIWPSVFGVDPALNEEPTDG